MYFCFISNTFVDRRASHFTQNVSYVHYISYDTTNLFHDILVHLSHAEK